jgi:tetratricopeptide (TPR) repeat protein
MTASEVEVPHQVPAGPTRFVNRDDELAVVAAQFRTAGARIVVCTGLPGVGKTALVRKAVERHPGAFPGGELLVEFGGGTSVGDALGSCLLALGVSASVLPATVADRVGLYRTRTAGQATLVVLDDAADPAQVVPLVPSAPGSVVLVTSTSRMTELRVDGAEIVDVAPLDEESGTRMLRELCGSRVDGEPEALAALVRACDGMPIVLRAAAVRLLRRGMTVADLVREVADERRGLTEPADAVFSLVYRQLPAGVAALYRTLGVLPWPDFTVRSAAAAAAITERDAALLLDELVEQGLVQQDRRFRMHSLVRRHAEERALTEDPDTDRTAAVHRAVVDLVRQAAYADRAVLGDGRYRCTPHDRWLTGEDPFPTRKAALAWLDAERGNLAAGVRVCAGHGWHDLAWQLAESATALYVTYRHYLDWIETSGLGATSAGLAGHVAAEARLRSFMSRPLTELGHLPRARAELDAAFALAGNTSDVRLRASIHEMDGRYHDATGDPAAAAAAFGRALELFRSVGDERGEAFVSVFVGAAQLRAGEPRAALATLTGVLERMRKFDVRMTGRAMIAIGRAHAASGDLDAARDWLSRASETMAKSNDVYYEAEAEEALAEVATPTAREHLRRAHDLLRELGSPRADELARRLMS